MLIASGAVTGVPLLLFAGAARRIPLSLIGVLQYLAPTLNFLLGVAVYGERFDGGRLVGFALIWTGVAVFATDGWRSARRPLRHASSRREDTPG